MKQQELRYINQMINTPGWDVFHNEIERRISVLQREMVITEFSSMDDALKIKGIVHEIRALQGLLSYIANRRKQVEGS